MALDMDWTYFRNCRYAVRRQRCAPKRLSCIGQIHFLLGNLYLKLNQPDLAAAHLAKFHAPQTTQRCRKKSNQIVLDTHGGQVKPQVRTHRIAIYSDVVFVNKASQQTGQE
jgi:hypothetical protein